MAAALALMAKRTSRRRAGTGPCPPAMTKALRPRAPKVLPLAALVDRLPVGLAGLRVTELAVLLLAVLLLAVLLLADPRLASLARSLPVALAGLLLAAEPVGPPRLALVVKAPQRRRF